MSSSNAKKMPLLLDVVKAGTNERSRLPKYQPSKASAKPDGDTIAGETPHSEVVRVAIAGLGRVGRLHALNLISLPGVHLVAAYDPTSTAQEWISTNLVPRHVNLVTDSFESFLLTCREEDVDLVWLATPTSEHLGQISQVLEHGMHVFCEKPLTSGSEEEDSQLLALTEKFPNQLVIPGFSRRFDPSYYSVYQTLVSGEVGRVHTMYSHTLDLDYSLSPSMLDPSLSEADRLEREKGYLTYLGSSGGIFLDCLIHDIDLAIWFLGSSSNSDSSCPVKVKRVFATGQILRYPTLTQSNDADNVVAIVEFITSPTASTTNGNEEKAVLTLHGSRTIQYGHDCSSTLWTTGGHKLTVNSSPWRDSVQLFDQMGNAKTRVQQDWSERFAEAFEIEAKEVVAAVSEVKYRLRPSGQLEPPRGLTVQSALLGIKIARALQKSFREGKEVKFDDEGAEVLS